MTGVYYADLFEINGVGCLVMGCGKSDACTNYTGESTKEIWLDSIRLEYSDGKLWGYVDPFMGFLPPVKITDGIEIKYLIYMDSEEETQNSNIISISKDKFCMIAKSNIIYACTDIASRENEFKELIECSAVECIEVPWCDRIETKGELIKNYIK